MGLVHSPDTTNSASTWYIDCHGGADTADGVSPKTAWKSLALASNLSLGPGDRLLFRRGTTCLGSLSLNGSGSRSSPIEIGAYGVGALPVIEAVGGDEPAEAVLHLRPGSGGWVVGQLELTGHAVRGLFVEQREGAARHLQIYDLAVRDIYAGVPIASKATGLVVLLARGEGRFEEVSLDGVRAWNTDQWGGIVFDGAEFEHGTPLSRGVSIRNSVVHDVEGDGIVVFSAKEAIIETSLAYRTGAQETLTLGTPNGIWTWNCENCTVQFNEGYAMNSPGVDGGIFDIDWATSDNLVQFNYGHDAAAYCFAVFGAHGYTTQRAVIRNNICRDNGQSARHAQQGDVYLRTWKEGVIDAVEIHDNIFIWDTSQTHPLLVDQASLGSGASFFSDNLIFSATSDTMEFQSSLEFNDNQWFLGGDTLGWVAAALNADHRMVAGRWSVPPGMSLTGADEAAWLVAVD